MRKSKYDQSSLPVQNSKDIDKDNNISKIENRVDFDTELVNLVNQIEDIKAAIQELRQIKAFVDSSVSTFEESAQALKAAVKTSNNISNAICRIFMQVENTVITVKLSEEDKSILAEYRHKLIEEEKTLFEKQITELKTLLDIVCIFLFNIRRINNLYEVLLAKFGRMDEPTFQIHHHVMTLSTISCCSALLRLK